MSAHIGFEKVYYNLKEKFNKTIETVNWILSDQRAETLKKVKGTTHLLHKEHGEVLDL